jgi:hypothetical protein
MKKKFCPYIDKRKKDVRFNKPITQSNGYIYYIHKTPDNEQYPVQFCSLKGRVRDYDLCQDGFDDCGTFIWNKCIKIGK